jgi:hypothetical protein
MLANDSGPRGKWDRVGFDKPALAAPSNNEVSADALKWKGTALNYLCSLGDEIVPNMMILHSCCRRGDVQRR